MSFSKGLRLTFSFLGIPAGIGVGAHQLTHHYSSLMDFSSTFFLVQVTEGLFDKGIPNVPQSVEKAVDAILKQKQQALELLKKKRNRRSLPQETSSSTEDSFQSTTVSDEVSLETDDFAEDAEVSASQEQQQIFGTGERKFWCRYFDYSGGKENVILEYDPSCTFYNIFDITGKSAQRTQKASVPTTTESNKNMVINLSGLQGKTSTLAGKELKSNDEFKKGGFYLLKLDKTKIPNVNSSFNIELSEPGDGKRQSERVYHKKIATVKIQAELNGDPSDEVNFNFPALPSSKLILKKVENGSVGTQASSAPAPSPSSSSAENESVSYYFKTSQDNSEKLYVEDAWSFSSNGGSSSGSTIGGDSDLSKKFDLSTLDKEPLEVFKANGVRETTTSSNDNKHYIFNNYSDFWNYKVGDTITLYKSTQSKTARRRRGAETSSNPQEKEEAQATFKVVSGALTTSYLHPRCVPKNKKQKKTFKPNLRKDGIGLLEIEAAKKKGSCKGRDGLPDNLLILIGYQGDSQVPKK